MIKRYLKIIVIIFFVSQNSCKKDDVNTVPISSELEDEWPIFVDTGANIVAYKVDGKIRVNKNLSNTNNRTIVCAYFKESIGNMLFYFEAYRITDISFNQLRIILTDAKDTGYYKLVGTEGLYQGAYFEGKSSNLNKPYITNYNDTGYVYISKIDTIKNVITGTFEFKARYFFGDQEKNITQGRFDLKY